MPIFFLLSLLVFVPSSNNNNNNNNNLNPTYFEKNENTSFELVSAKDSWDKEKQLHHIDVFFKGDIPDGTTYDILDGSQSILDQPKEVDISTIYEEGGQKAFYIEIDNEKIIFEHQYNLKLEYNYIHYQEISFETTFENQEFENRILKSKTKITSHSIKFVYHYKQANPNAYLNKSTGIYLKEKDTSSLVAKKHIVTNKNVDNVTVLFDDLNVKTNYSVSVTNNNNKKNIEKEAFSFVFSTTEKKITFNSEINFKPNYDDISGIYSWTKNSHFSLNPKNIFLELIEEETNEVISKVIINIGSIENGKQYFSFKDGSSLQPGQEIKDGTKYSVTETKEFPGVDPIITEYSNITTLKKQKRLFGNTNINFNESTTNVSGNYSWKGNDFSSDTSSIENVTLDLYYKEDDKKLSPLAKQIPILDENDDETGIKDFSFDVYKEKSLDKEKTLTVVEIINYADDWQEPDTNNYDFNLSYEPTTFSIKPTSSTYRSNFNIDIKLKKIDKFKNNHNEKIKVEFTTTDLNKYNVVFMNPISGEENRRGNSFSWGYEDIEKFPSFKNGLFNSATFSLNFSGLKYNQEILYNVSLDSTKESKSITPDFSKGFLIDSDKFNYVESIENDNKTCSYKLKWEINNPEEIQDFSDRISFSGKIPFAKPDPKNFDKKISVMDEETAKNVFGTYDYNSYLYLTVDQSLVNKRNPKNLSFLTNRYIFYKNPNISMNIDSYDYFFIDSYIKTLPFKLIILSSILVLWIMFTFLSIYIYNTSSKKRFEFLEAYSKEIYRHLISNYKLYGINSKAENYIKISNMNDKELEDYLKEIDVQLPPGQSRNEIINISSLLTNDEILFVQNLIDYELKIEHDTLEKSYSSFNRKEDAWLRKLLKGKTFEDIIQETVLDEELFRDEIVIEKPTLFEKEESKHKKIKNKEKLHFFKKEDEEKEINTDQTEEDVVLDFNPYENGVNVTKNNLSSEDKLDKVDEIEKEGEDNA